MDNNSSNTNNGVIDMFSTRLRTYLIPLIFGYFLIKLFFATFGVYPKKYYNQTMTINSNDENADKESVLNAYVPGLWNSELTDFLVMVMMSLILFFVKGNGLFPLSASGGINYTLWIIPARIILSLVIDTKLNQIVNEGFNRISFQLKAPRNEFAAIIHFEV